MSPSAANPNLKAVIFDVRAPHTEPFPDQQCTAVLTTLDIFAQIGGVVCRSQLIAIAQYERENSIPNNYINCSMFVFPDFCLRSTFNSEHVDVGMPHD